MPPLPVQPQTEPLEQFIDNLSQLPVHTIGRKEGNTLVILNGKVSGQHARLIQCTPDSFVLEDLASKNGTFVNDQRITRKVIDKDDAVRFADTEYSLNQLLALVAPPVPKPQPPKSPTANDFTRAFADLQQVFEQYPRLKRDCRNRDKMIRTGSVILSSIVGVSAVLSTGGGILPFIQIMSGAGLGVLVPTLCSALLSTDEKLEILEKEYREKYRCPNPACRDPFVGREWEQLARQKTCRRCQAIWVN